MARDMAKKKKYDYKVGYGILDPLNDRMRLRLLISEKRREKITLTSEALERSLAKIAKRT